MTDTPDRLTEIPRSDDFVSCYGCGPRNEHGARIHFALDEAARRVEATWAPPGHFAGYRRMVHGGVIATMLDEAMGWALWGLARRVGVTREMVVRFHRPIVIEKPYRILGRIERMDDAEATVLAEVRDARDRLAADGTGEFTFISLDKVRDHRRPDRPETDDP